MHQYACMLHLHVCCLPVQDGLNRDGSLTRSYNKFNYSDYDPIYVPVNDAFTLRDPTKWQPLMETNELG